MHDGCAGPGIDGQQVVQKIRLMGFNQQMLPAPLNLECKGCNKEFTMTHFETACPECGMVHGVTPCSADNPANVKAAGVGF